MLFTLVDAGYLLFYRYHATKLWYKRARDYTDDLQMASDPDFIDTFTKRVESSIQEILKKNGGEWSTTIICCDCRRSEIWRNQHVQHYKANRDNSNHTGLAEAARHYHQKLKDIVAVQGAHMFKVPTAEADDVAAHTKIALQKRFPEARFQIITSDMDYFQLLDSQTQIVRLDKKDPCKQSVGDPQLDLLVKIIVGDKSDNIPGCFPKCGAKTALKLAQDAQLLETYFHKHPGSREKYKHNQRLIDFGCVPPELVKQIQALSEPLFTMT